MRSILTFAIATIIAVGAIAPVSAATKSRRAPAPDYATEQPLVQAPVSAARQPGVPNAVWQQPNACFTDEGYGRYASCDQGGGQ